MEALGAGCVTFVGPYHENNREASQFNALNIDGLSGVQVVRDASELSEHMRRFLNEPLLVTKFSESLKKEFASRLGASSNLVESLTSLL